MPPLISSAVFQAYYKNLAKISSFVTKAAETAGLDEHAIYAVQRSVDEACSNIIEHAYQGKEGGDIECLCVASDTGLIIRLKDYGKPFEPRKIPSPNLNTDLSKRPVGGLGLYFMHRLMDEISFEFPPDITGNSVVMVKYNDRHLLVDLWPQIVKNINQLATITTLSEQCEFIRNAAGKLFESHVILWLDPGWCKASEATGCETFSTNPPTDLISQAYSGKQGVYTDNVFIQHDLPVNTPGEYEKLLHKHYKIAVPLSVLSYTIGGIQVERSGLYFSKVEAQALESFANQIALTLYATRQVLIERLRLEQLSLVRSVSSKITNMRSLEELARSVSQLIFETFNYYYVAIFTCQPGQDLLNFQASYGPQNGDGALSDFSGIPIQIHLGKGLIGTAASTGFIKVSNDVGRDSIYQFLDILPETKSEVAVPLKLGNQVLGVLDVQSEVLNAFDDTDLLVFNALADNIAIAVEGTRLYAELRQHAEQLATVAEINNAITSILNFNDLLSEVVRLLRERLNFQYVQVFTVNLVYGEINYAAGSSPYNEEYCEECVSYKLDDPEGLIPLAARNASTVIANDVTKEPRYRPSGDFPVEIRSEMVIPLLYGGQVQGILDIQSDKVYAFRDDTRSLFEALADNIAVAIRNAQLYRSEAWRRKVADSMHAVAGLLSADVSLPNLLSSILGELEKTLPCDIAVLWLIEPQLVLDEDNPPHFQLAAFHSKDPSIQSEKIEKLLDEESETRSWLVKALYAEIPIIRTRPALNQSSLKSEPFRNVLGLPENYSAIATPLRTGTTALGVLTLIHNKPDRFGPESQAMTTTFASYAAVAIENARLYEATHDQAWVSTVLLQVAEATQSITDIDELLATVVQITPLLVGVNACAFMMWDEDSDAFMPGAAQGLTAEQQNDFDQWIIHPGDESAFDQLRVVKTPVLLPNWSFSIPENVDNSQSSDNFVEDIYHSKPLVLFPMVAQETVLGGLLVDFTVTQNQREIDITSEEFLRDEKLSVIQGIAHQTAIAVENIHLLKAQKEEAYVSVALLQVAQAVVSLIDLHEILETIVRIAPILVGVNRCAIYLWDETRRGFLLAQCYGFLREIEEYLSTRLYQLGEYPLLDVAFERNKLAYISLDDSTIQPTEWEQMIPDGESFTFDEAIPGEDAELETSEVEQGYGDEILRHLGPLLYAFPLSVKGSPLGVLLAEEAPSASGTLTYRVRERRLEILTGITQQTSLAIQNDRLQSEVVERERLEREMQLARSIQQTFLPQQLPSIPKWDLDMRWRTARQVGGDFYDLFQLPGGKLGIVIADVADKGMPAALFMTLVRTLIRAAVQVEISPSAVLDEVNHLMLPDTQNGMFVTAIYAVLSLDTGKLVYANAGHNLPLLLRAKNKEVSQLHKGGIALGVIEDTNFKDYSLQLEPGDCVVFYTDGVTEAFSPREEMYGEERLLDTLRAACCDSASLVLDAIDHSVDEFIGDSPRADDLTMVAIRRIGA